MILYKNDYMSDCQEFLNPSLLKMPAATDRIKEDIRLVFNFFSAFKLKPAKDLEVDFEYRVCGGTHEGERRPR